MENNAACPGERVTFTCTVPSDTHGWRITDGSTELQIGYVTPVSPTTTNLGFELQIMDITAVPITSTATVNVTVDLNSTVIVCTNVLLPPNRIEQNTTVSNIGELLTCHSVKERGEAHNICLIEIHGRLHHFILKFTTRSSQLAV